jgi:hypothetical protein
MNNRIPAALARALTRLFAVLTMATSQRLLCGLALTCLVLASCLISGAGSTLAASDENASPKSGPAVAGNAAVGPTVVVVYSNSGLLQRRRQAIARLLEGSLVYRTLFDVKLINTKLAGPFPYKYRNSLFSADTHTETLYCASADLDVPWIHAVKRIALIRVGQSSNGTERLYGKVPNYFPPECSNANYGPFPELEQARARRRHALGKSD